MSGRSSRRLHRPPTFDAEGGVDTIADVTETEWKREKTINMHSRSQPSKSVVAPLVRCPSCAASTAARSTCQIHCPAQPACLLACLPLQTPLFPSTAACQSGQSAPFRLPVPERETVGYDVIGCAGQRQQRSCLKSGKVCCSCEMDNAGYCEKEVRMNSITSEAERNRISSTVGHSGCQPQEHKRKRWPREPPTVSREQILGLLGPNSPSWAPSHANSSFLSRPT